MSYKVLKNIGTILNVSFNVGASLHILNNTPFINYSVQNLFRGFPKKPLLYGQG